MNRTHEAYDRLLARAKALPAVTTAIAHPCDVSSLTGAVDAARMGAHRPHPDGPCGAHPGSGQTGEPGHLGLRDRGCAAQPCVGRRGSATGARRPGGMRDERQPAHRRSDGGGGGARRGPPHRARRISHCFVMDVPSYNHPLIISDAAVNIAPSLEDKVHIVQNAIDLGHALGIAEVRVAILSAMETVNPKVPSTVEAAALCKMADRGQITGGILDGPLALDNAIDLQAAAIKKIASPVAGRANVLIVPDLEAGNMLTKSLIFLAGADAAGIVLGAKVPIILTSRADSVTARLASCAVASLVAQARREALSKAVQ